MTEIQKQNIQKFIDLENKTFSSNKLKINKNIFTYKESETQKPLKWNSFVVDLETYNNLENEQQPLTTIISFALLNYLKREEKDNLKYTEYYFEEEFNPIVYDIINDTNQQLKENYVERELELFQKSLDKMISILKKKSDSASNKVYLYMFNNSRYDNSYFMKILIAWGYRQIFSKKFFKEVLNKEEIGQLQNQLQQLLDNGADDKSIKKIRKEIKDKVSYSNKYDKQFRLLAGDRISYLSLEFTYRNYIFILKDFCRFYKTSLSDLGKTLQIKKLKEIGNKYYEKDFTTLTKQEWEEYKLYAAEDIHILFEGIKRYSGFLTLDKDKLMTISSLTLDKWKQSDANNWRYLKIHILEDEWDIGNQSYRGGFSFGNEKYLNTLLHNVNTYDINSSYPSVMVEKVAVERVDKEKYMLTNLDKTILHHIEIDSMVLRDDMLPIFPYLGKYINNSFYKDYDVRKQKYIHENFIKKLNNKNLPFEKLTLWVWEEELEWFKKFYKVFVYKVLDSRFFIKRDIFKDYVKQNYLTKSQADTDKMIVSIINQYLKDRNLTVVETEMNKQFSLVFNDKNNSLNPNINYHQLAKEVILQEVKKIDSMNESEIKQYQLDIDNQLLYLDTLRITTKLYLNSLYGKFGENPNNESYYVVDKVLTPRESYEVVTDELLLEKEHFKIINKKNHQILNNKVYNYSRIDKLPEYGKNVYISSYITMRGRCKLYEIIYQYGNDKILYGDTDSIKMIGELDEKYINNSELGKWKYEGTYETFAYIGSKKYMYRDNKGKFGFTIAGVNQTADIYKDYKTNRNTQDRMFTDFINMNIKLYKKASLTDKQTGVKLITNNKEIVLVRKDNTERYISVNDRYEKLKKKQDIFNDLSSSEIREIEINEDDFDE